jgi:hypothetical protein
MARPDYWETCTTWCERVVYCIVCHKRKTPRGRSAPMEMRCCDNDCPGYAQEPTAGHLWPGELAEMDAPEGEVEP